MGFFSTLGGVGGAIGGGLLGGPAGIAAGYAGGSALGSMADGGPDERGGKYAGQDINNYNLPGFQQQYNQYGGLAQHFANQQAAQAQGSQYNGMQRQSIGQLGREANGQGIGQALIRQQAQGQADRIGSQGLATAASARPGQSALASRNAAFNTANAQSQVGGQVANAAGQYQLGAMQQYNQALAGARGQDDQFNQANAQLRYQQMGLNNSSQLEALRGRLATAQGQQQGTMGYEQGRTNRYGAAQGQPTGQERTYGAISGGLQAYAQYANGQNQGGGQNGVPPGSFNPNGSATFV